MTNRFSELDRHLFDLIRRPQSTWVWLDAAAIFCAEYLPYVLLAVIGIALGYAHQWQPLLLALLSGLVARFIVNEAVYTVYKRKRPFEVLGFAPLIKKPGHPALPSGHAAFFFGFAFSLLTFQIPLALVCISLVFLTCFSRVYSGVHWPSDIIAGAGVAALVSGLVAYYL